jgi:hypothetical protein
MEDTEGCFIIFVGVGTVRRLLLGRTELKKLDIVPDIVGLRVGIVERRVQGARRGLQENFVELTNEFDDTVCLACIILAFSSWKKLSVCSPRANDKVVGRSQAECYHLTNGGSHMFAARNHEASRILNRTDLDLWFISQRLPGKETWNRASVNLAKEIVPCRSNTSKFRPKSLLP